MWYVRYGVAHVDMDLNHRDYIFYIDFITRLGRMLHPVSPITTAILNCFFFYRFVVLMLQ